MEEEVSEQKCPKCGSIQIEAGPAISSEMREVEGGHRGKPIPLPDMQLMRCASCGHKWKEPVKKPI
jgi:hypothetical protein